MIEQYEEAYKEALASATYKVILDTLEIMHPDVLDPLYVVNGNRNITAPLVEGETAVEFNARAFQFKQPDRNEEGTSELSISIDNVDRVMTDWLESVADSNEPVKIRYRVYLAEDLTGPQNVTPIELYLSDVNVNSTSISAKARFTDFVNTAFPSELYTRRRFLSLR